jgi:hypothetical protein
MHFVLILLGGNNELNYGDEDLNILTVVYAWRCW